MLSVDVNNLENRVKPILRNGKKYLDDAKRYLNITSIPNDFEYASRLRRIPTDITNIQATINSIEKWLEKSVESFKNLENKNKNLINSINASTKGMATSLRSAKIRQTGSGAVVDKNDVNVEIANRIVNTTKNTVFNVLSYKENNVINMKDIMKATSAQAAEAVANSMSNSVITGTYIAGGVESTIIDNVINAIDKVGCVVSDTIDLVKDGASKAWNWTKETASDVWDWAKDGVSSVWNWAKDGISDAWDWTKSAVKKTIASVANVFIGVLKGLNSLVEAFTDIIAVVGTGIASIFTGIFDLATDSSVTSDMWKGVMGYVTENQTENKFKNFYENKKAGQWLDKNAIDLCKSDGLITNIASGLGYVSGIIALTVATGGLGGLGILSSAAVSAGYATAAGAGKYTAESWEKSRDSSWEGIERMKDKGEISQEQYDSFVAIRGFSDEQWEAIKADFESGNITEEMYNQMKQIREMLDDWRTLENGVKGLIYGAANGVWEGIQFYVGSKLAGTVINGASSMTNSAVRVSADTAFNALDTPYRTLVDALVNDKSLEQSWMEQGAWKSVLTSVGVGLIGSIGGEAFSSKFGNSKVQNADEIVNTNSIDLEEEIMKANMRINQNVEHVIHVDNLDSIPKEVFDSIQNPKGIVFSANGEKIDFMDAKSRAGYSNWGNTNINSSTQINISMEEQISQAKYHTGRGEIYTIKANSLDELPPNVLEQFDNPNTLVIDVNGKIYNYANFHELNTGYSTIAQTTTNTISEPIKLNNAADIAIFFNDPKGFICNKLNINPYNISTGEVIRQYSSSLSIQDQTILKQLIKNQRNFTLEESTLLKSFSKWSGAVYSSKLRNTDVIFERNIFKGREGKIVDLDGNVQFESYADYVNLADSNLGLNRNFISIDDDIAKLDNIIENSPKLEQSIIVSRNVDSIFKDGEQLLTFNVGDTFNDKSFLSTSVNTGEVFKNRKIKLEIEVPKGTKAAYIQSEVSGINGFNQQELLLARNGSYQIVEPPQFNPQTGQMIIKAKLLQEESIINKIGANQVNSNNVATKYYENCWKNSPNQVDLSNVVGEMKSSGLLGRYEAEVRDIHMSGFYRNTMPEHGLEHVEDVLFDAMYMGNKLGLTDNEMNVLIEAAKFHDCGRANTGMQHGIEGAQNSEHYLKMSKSEQDIAMIQAAIEYHAYDGDFNKILNKYGVKGQNRVSATKIANILKDADALDRARFPGNLNENRLRTDISKQLIKSSHQLQELRGKNFLNETFIENVNANLSDVNTIQFLRNKGVSDYEISFWINNDPNVTNFPMPVWNKVNVKMQQILQGT